MRAEVLAVLSDLSRVDRSTVRPVSGQWRHGTNADRGVGLISAPGTKVSVTSTITLTGRGRSG